MNPATFEVLSNGEIKGPLAFSGIRRGVYDGRFRVEDSYRRKGSTEWKPIRQTLRRNLLFETIGSGAGCIGFCLVGLWLTWQGLRFIGLERESSFWPSVHGRITYAQVQIEARAAFKNVPSVGYIYQVGTKKYFGDTIYLECINGGRMHWAQSVIARYPAGNDCLVHYSPANPRRTILEPGLAPHSFTFAGFGVMLTYAGVLNGLLALSTWQKPIDQRPSRSTLLRDLFLLSTVIIGFIFVAWLP